MSKTNPRSLPGMLGLIAGLTAYAFAVAGLAAWLMPMPFLLEILFYLFFGIVWIFPARAVINWIGRAQPR
ncbi:MAG: DUF2842 domain-containing protein [Rhodothalassiaceae bacterium]